MDKKMQLNRKSMRRISLEIEEDNRKSLYQEAWNVLLGAQTIVITTHIHPDGDAVGSSLALWNYLKGRGKNVQVVIDFAVPSIYSYLSGYEQICKPDNPRRTELIVVLDTSVAEKRIGSVAKFISDSILNIDHHDTNEGLTEISIVEPYRASTCEILFAMFEEAGIEINKAIAECLYTGMATDTGFFRFPSTNSKTFEMAEKLVCCGASPSRISSALETRKYEEIQLYSCALGQIERFQHGRIAGVFLDEEFREFELSNGIIDIMRYMEGVEIAVLMQYDAENNYRVRMRSNGIDISSIAKSYGGGGHEDSAGFSIFDHFENARYRLVKDMKEWLVGKN